MVPLTALAVPTYLLFSKVGLTDTPWAIILPSLVSPFGVYLMRVYAAQGGLTPCSRRRVDGASEARIFFSVVLRLLAPGFVTVLLFAVATWNNYFLPLIMLNSPEYFPLGGPRAVAGHLGRRFGLPGPVLDGDHRLAGLHRPARRRVPVPAAVLAVGARDGRRQELTTSCTN